MPKKPKPIPTSVLAVLKHEWRQADPEYSSFDSVFNDKEDRGRRSEPSYYNIPKGKDIESDFDQFTHAEALKLVNQGAFGSLAKVQDDDSVTINEHAQHAMTDFCSEVYSAWQKYLSRITKIEKACPPL